MLGEHEGDGVLSVYGNVSRGAAGTEYVPAEASSPNAIFPLFDWQALNGITAEHAPPVETCGADNVWPVINTAFVGAACDGMYAAFAHDTATHNLTAQRSFFFFDAAIIALASRITDPVPNANPRTAIASRLLPYPAAAGESGALAAGFLNGTVIASLADGAYVLPQLGDISWLHAGGIGYVPAALGPASSSPATSLRILVNNASGEWSSIGPFSGTATARVLQVQLDHGDGAAALDETYAYAVLPATAAADMPTLARTLTGVDRECVANSATVQGAADPAAAVTQVIFWSAGGGAYTCNSSSVAGWSIAVTSPAPAIVVVREANRSVTVNVAHPNLLAPQSAHITIGGRPTLAGPACSQAPGGGTIFNLPFQVDANYLGATVSATCTY